MSIISEPHIQHGDLGILTVEQGFVGLAFDNGQPVLLPPGLHQWKSDTLKFRRMIDLQDHCISLGPYTLLTVDEGYAAVTQNNGKQIILPGGECGAMTDDRRQTIDPTNAQSPLPDPSSRKKLTGLSHPPPPPQVTCICLTTRTGSLRSS